MQIKQSWELLAILFDEHFQIEMLEESSDLLADFTYEISESCIPKTNPKKNKPMYSDKCLKSLKQRREALSRFFMFLTGDMSNDVKDLEPKQLKTTF